MTQRKRSRLFPTQEIDVWKRWKAGQSLHAIGRVFASRILQFAIYCCLAEGLLRMRRRSRLASAV